MAITRSCNPFRVLFHASYFPRVARSSQPWAEFWNSFGILSDLLRCRSRFASIHLITILLLLLTSSAAFAGATLTLGSVRGQPGATVSVPLTLIGATDVVALQADVLFDTNVVSAGTISGGPALAGQIFGYNQVTSGVLRVLIYSFNNIPLATGTIANLQFNIAPRLPGPAIVLSLTNLILTTTNVSPLAVSDMAGLIALYLFQFQTNGASHGFLAGVDGQRYVIQATTNLINWVTVDTNVAVGSFIQFSDPDAWRYRWRFYRGVPPPCDPPVITQQPQSATVPTGGTTNFTVVATGCQPLTYQWRFKGVNISGATNSTLIITNAQHANEGLYQVRVTNPAKTISSAPPTLTVSDVPVISQQPSGTNVTAGATVTLLVAAAGAAPLHYQWIFNGSPLDGATSSSLIQNNIQASRAGDYFAIVNNSVGSATSQVVHVNITLPLRLGWIASHTNGPFQLHVTWTAAQDFILQASTNLTTWVPIKTNTANSGLYEFVDPDASQYPQRFYRVRSNP